MRRRGADCQREKVIICIADRVSKTMRVYIRGGNKSKLIDRLATHAQSRDLPIASNRNVLPQAVSVRQRWISSGSSLQAEADKFKARWSRNLDVKLPETPDAVDEGPVIVSLSN